MVSDSMMMRGANRGEFRPPSMGRSIESVPYPSPLDTHPHRCGADGDGSMAQADGLAGIVAV